MIYFLFTGCEQEEVKQEQLPGNEVESTEPHTLGKKIDLQEIESNPKIIKELGKIGSIPLKNPGKGIFM